MRNFLTFLFVLAIGALSHAQESASGRCLPEEFAGRFMHKAPGTVGDFTITDTEGNVLNLYDKLNEGKTVFIDLFFVNCSWCQLYAPIIEEVYVNTGSGQGDILMWGLSPYDNNAAIDGYKIQYGITNPCAGTQGNGPAAIDVVIAGQPFLGYPTYCVVCPDKTMYFDVCYPPQVNCFNQYFDNCAQTVLIAQFGSDATEVCEGDVVSFTDASVGNVVTWQWTFEGGDPAVSGEQNPVVTYAAAGTFDVELTVSNGTSTNTLLMENYIAVHPYPEVSLAPFSIVCEYEPPFELTGGEPEGGVYSGPGVDNGWFDPEAAGIGVHTIVYTYSENDCSAQAEQTLEVDLCEGIEDVTGKRITLFPNPASEVLHISLASQSAVTITVYDMAGVIRLSAGVPAINGTVAYTADVAPLQNGIYMLEVRDGVRVYRRKITVVK